MHDFHCTCSVHHPAADGHIETERRIAAAVDANRRKLWQMLGVEARIAHHSDQMVLDRLTF